MALSVDDYLGQLQGLLPPGPAWTRDEDAALTRLLRGLAAEPTRIDARARKLFEEGDPRTVVEMLADYERVAGLPDPCVVTALVSQSIPQRRAALTARLTTVGGQTKAYFITLMASLGYTVTISEFKPFRAGQSSSGDPITTNWQFTWQVNASLNTVVPFRAGQSSAGDPLNAWGNKPMECVINRLRPAHSNVLFSYT